MNRIFVLLLICVAFLINNLFSQVSEKWAQRFTSDSSRAETVNDMFVDEQGNIYITGSQRYRASSPNEIEAVTVKYNSQGVQQWIQNYTATDSNGAFCRAIHVDVSGNVYVTGETAINSGGSNEALIIKYSPTGTQLWAKRFQYIEQFYAGGYDVITDASGNVYVTGEYYTGATFLNNIFLVKYSQSGDLINQTFYNSGSEGGRKIGLDGAGKIIIGGYINDNDSLSFIALKYEQNLDFDWAARWGKNVGNINPIDMTIDNNSNIILAGSDNINYATVKFNPSGVFEWGKLYNSSEGWDLCNGVVKDDLGNIYVTGETGISGSPFSYKMTTIKYSPNGDAQWVRAYYGDSSGTDGFGGFDVAIDNSANVYIVGQEYASQDIITIKYDNEGALQWQINYNGPSNGIDNPVAVGVDLNGNIYTAGNSIDTTYGQDIAIIKYEQVTTSVEGEKQNPLSFKLEQNYPNPFNPTTKIKYSIPFVETGHAPSVQLKVYDILGIEVAALVNENKPAGNYEATFNASSLSSGVYFYKLQAGSFVETKKMILLK